MSKVIIAIIVFILLLVLGVFFGAKSYFEANSPENIRAIMIENKEKCQDLCSQEPNFLSVDISTRNGKTTCTCHYTDGIVKERTLN